MPEYGHQTPQLESEKPLEPLRFIYGLPCVSERKLATIKLVAKYTVIDPSQLKDQHFDFQDPENSLYGLFQSFIKQYYLVNDGAGPLKGDVLLRAIRRAKEEAEQEEKEREKPKTSDLVTPSLQSAPGFGYYASINWQDFVVLETVEFFSADINGTSNLSAPFTRTDLELRKQKDERDFSEPLFKSALTGELVPASQYNEHIRVHSLDPSYKRQRAKEQERQQNSNLDTTNVADNLERLRQKRRRLMEEK